MADLTLDTLTNLHTPAILARFVRRVAEWRVRARQRSELALLSDRDLRDLGATRMEVEFELNKSFWQV
jgi:uncharacterized protein YjiS (DUF1127 family)